MSIPFAEDLPLLEISKLMWICTYNTVHEQYSRAGVLAGGWCVLGGSSVFSLGAGVCTCLFVCVFVCVCARARACVCLRVCVNRFAVD